MEVINACLSDVGRVREINEDYLAFREDDSKTIHKYGKCYIVCDGMGGHRAGEVASKMAAESFKEIYYSEELKEEKILERIRKTIETVNQKVFKEAKSNEEKKGMGTTIVGIIIKGSKGFVFNVGDSRCYLIRNDSIEQLTEDHSLVNELVKANIIDREEAGRSSKKNILTRAIGTDEKVIPFLKEVDALKGDRFVLCTDGLSSLVKDEEIKHIVKEEKPKDAAKKLIDLANERGGTDNITAVLLQLYEVTKLKKLVYASVIAVFSVILALTIKFMFAYTKISVDSFPQGATIILNGKNDGETPKDIKFVGDSAQLKVSKANFEEEAIDIYKKDGQIYYKSGNGEVSTEGQVVENNKISISLKKYISIKVVDSTGNPIPQPSIYIDGKPIDEVNNIPLSIGEHDFKIEKEKYKPLTEKINVTNGSDELPFTLKEINLFTLMSNPSEAKIEICDKNGLYISLINEGREATTPYTLDFGEYKGKHIRLIKEENSFMYIKYYTIPEDDSKLPSNGIDLEKYIKFNISSDITITPGNLLCNGKGMLIYQGKQWLIKYEGDTTYSIQAKGQVNGFNVEIEKSFKYSELSMPIMFNFGILKLNFQENSIELNRETGKENFSGKLYSKNLFGKEITEEFEVSKDNPYKANLKLPTVLKIEGLYNDIFHYTFIKGGL